MNEIDDRELLELAAKAYVDESWHGNESYMRGFMSTWNPLEDDGDALRLAVKIGLDVEWQRDSGYVKVYRNNLFGVSGCVIELFCVGDATESTRRAIVRAAAEIGRQM